MTSACPQGTEGSKTDVGLVVWRLWILPVLTELKFVKVYRIENTALANEILRPLYTSGHSDPRSPLNWSEAILSILERTQFRKAVINAPKFRGEFFFKLSEKLYSTWKPFIIWFLWKTSRLVRNLSYFRLVFLLNIESNKRFSVFCVENYCGTWLGGIILHVSNPLY